MSKRGQLSERWLWAIVVAVGCLVLAAIHLWWVMTYRDGFPLNVDEAGYTAIGINNYLGFENDGLHGWWEAVQTQTPNAPLLSAVTSVVLIFSPGVMQGFAVLIVFGVILTFATYGIGEQLAGPRLGALAALAVATSQGTFLFTREYIFALPTAAFLSCAVYALLRSDGLRLRWWSIAGGAAIGLMLLSRTMAVAFIPGLVAAAALLILARRNDDLPLRLLNFGLALLAGLLVAATWYWRNFTPVYDYLTNFGYGSQAQYFGEEQSTLSWARFESVGLRLVQGDLLVPLATLVVVGLAVGAFLLGRRLHGSDDRRGELWRLAGSGPIAVSVIFIAGYAALMSSTNAGNGFTYPLAMLLPPLAVVSLRYFRAATIPVAVLVGAIALVNLAATSSLWDDVSKTRLVAVPFFGELPWVTGEAHAVAGIREQVPGPIDHFDTMDEGWTEVDSKIASLLLSPIAPEGMPRLSAFASRNRVVSTNSVGLAALLDHHVAIPFTQLLAEPNDSVATYTRQLTTPIIGEPTAVVTTSTEVDDFEPLVSQDKVEIALRRANFRLARAIPMPDGRQARIWVIKADKRVVSSKTPVKAQ
ncbi:MAG TPA: glycosyltransferase family 39 protein [Solirubrobacterales bacterium]|nr:glycosyltransferase family 39 protein [Solirubrobacterales bacterium]